MYDATPAPVVPTCAYDPAAPVLRSTLNPVSFDELSAHATDTLLADAEYAAAPDGAAGTVAAAVTWNVYVFDFTPLTVT